MAHGAVNGIIPAGVLGLSCESIFRIGQRYGFVNVIRYHGEHAAAELMNGFAR